MKKRSEKNIIVHQSVVGLDTIYIYIAYLGIRVDKDRYICCKNRIEGVGALYNNNNNNNNGRVRSPRANIFIR